ncbi:hypothetical protein GCM10022200_21550 [Microbacterium awajiense]|uniref:DUF624 domain-containing protein n=1 Tax=Microbacterium awajiense TaxID=415214 RepID=A0ABP7ARB5_9MICO
MTDPRWFRILTVYASLVTLFLSWAVWAITLVGLAPATVAAVAAARRMLQEGEAVTFSAFSADVRGGFRRSIPVAAGMATTMLIAWAATTTAGMARGMLFAIAVAVGTATFVVALVLGVDDRPAGPVLRRAVLLMVFRPGATAVVAAVLVLAPLVLSLVPTSAALVVGVALAGFVPVALVFGFLRPLRRPLPGAVVPELILTEGVRV